MSASPHYRLTMRKGPLQGKKFDLTKSLLTIGREVKNDIVINDVEVSRQHLRLTEQPSGYWVEDLASTNGTFVNGQRVSGSVGLRPGDILGLGGTIELEYAVITDPAATVATGVGFAAPAAPPPSAAPAEAPAPPVSAPPEPAPAFSLPSTPPPAPQPAAPAFAAPSSAAPAAGGFQMQPWMWAVAAGCGLLAVCGCGVVVLLTIFGPQLGRLLNP